MFSTNIILLLFSIVFIVNGSSEIGDIDSSTLTETQTLFEEIGFSPQCVSQTLAVCENVEQKYVVEELKQQLELLQESIDRLQGNQSSPSNCADLLRSGDSNSGVKTVYPYQCYPNRAVPVYCDQTTDGGGWTLFQHRENLTLRENFFREWLEYKLGFGNLTGEFWLGLDNIHALASQTLMELRVDLEDYDGDHRWAKYEYFYIGSDEENYKLALGTYSGTGGDSLSYQNGQQFSTKDQDNDLYPGNCAVRFKGAWWYNSCHDSNLNGYQYEGEQVSYADGIIWTYFRGDYYSLKITSLSLRPKFMQSCPEYC